MWVLPGISAGVDAGNGAGFSYAGGPEATLEELNGNPFMLADELIPLSGLASSCGD